MGGNYFVLFILTAFALILNVSAQVNACTNGDIRLSGGKVSYEGRVEYCYQSSWGTVCDDGWGTTEAAVVCSQLGYSAQGAVAFGNAVFGEGNGTIVFDDVFCTGAETNITDCFHSGLGVNDCSHFEDAGVRCQAIVIGSVCNDGDVRLVGGVSENEGRVEICINNTWGTVCDDSWSAIDAGVVCGQLNYSTSGAIALTSAYYGAGSGPIYLDEVGCFGSEGSLLACVSLPVGLHNCIHGEDAGVHCTVPCNDGDIRLAGANVDYEGRVELCQDSEWGTVCDNLWDSLDAMVVCRQLGYPTEGAVAFGNAVFGEGTGTIVFDNVFCTGNETNITECSHSGLGVNNCDHSEDAGVRCQAIVIGSMCNDGDVRLVDGASENEGRVEICISNAWGTVCDDSWSAIDAGVVCGQLNYSTTGAIALTSAYYGAGSGPIYLDNVGCFGSEGSLLACVSLPVGSHNCVHGEDASVQCVVPCNDGDIRLAGANFDYEGRVELCQDSEWGTVCDNLWDSLDAMVVCRQLGYPTEEALATGNAIYGEGAGAILLDNVFCNGSESSLLDCPHNGVGVHNCAHSGDAGVRCPVIEHGEVCNAGDIRLVGGLDQSEGRVEICINDQWGTVCDDGWNYNDAIVVCSQLGFPFAGAIAYSNAYFGEGSGPIYMDNVACSGTESSLYLCSSLPLGSHNCGHYEDAGVGCPANCTDGELRLVNANVDFEGRVEICIDGFWGTVCDDSWGPSDAAVVCNQLGYTTTGALAFGSAAFGAGVGDIFLDNVGCTGTESTLLSCPNNGIGSHDCSHFEDAGVRCYANTASNVCTTGDLRLVGGSDQYQGRVEICINNTWGTVCDDGWSNTDAIVVCAQLGYETNGAQGYSSAHFGVGNGSIFLDQVECVGTELQLLSCPSSPIGTHNCYHFEDAGVQCGITDICQLPAQPGNCRARIKRYYYNSDIDKCQKFTYGGCNGNENNFKTMKECRKQCEKSIDCDTVKCQVPTCPDPIPPNPAEGECCSVCPPGSTCPIQGQVYHECIGCPPTCNDYDEIVPCPPICVPGCACPIGKIFNEQSSICVLPEQCPGTCELNPEVGTCRGAFPRYFYNATSKQCEHFIYGGCGGNDNNFETLVSCEKNCSECAPTCTADFCNSKLNAKCSIPSEETHNGGSCFGDCDETVCSACYYSNETLPMPTLKEDCPTLCPVDAKGEIFGMTCLRKWGKCVRSANLATYGKPTSELKATENFKCWRPSCPSYS